MSRGVSLVSVLLSNPLSTSVSFVGLPRGAYFVKKGDTLYSDIACPDCPPTSGVPIVIGPDTPSAALSFGPPPQGRVSGTVRDPGSAGLSTIAVELYTDAGRIVGSALTDVRGNYSLPSIHPGTYFLRTRNDRGYVDKVFANGACASCDVRTGTPVVVASAGVTGIDFTLSTGGLVSGVVTDMAGVPVGGVAVSVFSPAGMLAEKAVASAVGRFRVTLPAGSYRARAEPSATHGAEVFSERACTSAACEVTAGTPIAVTTGTTTATINFTLTSCSAMTLSPPILASGVVGRTFRQVLSTSGGASPYRFQVTDGALPLGVRSGCVEWRAGRDADGVGAPWVHHRRDRRERVRDGAGLHP